LFGIVLFFIVIGVAFFSVYYAMANEKQNHQSTSIRTTYSLPAGDPTLTICTNGENVVLAMKVHIRIILLGSTIEVPARIGMFGGRTRSIFTKDTSGTIYIELPINYRFSLRDFFAIWNQAFSKNQIFSLAASANHPINITVNGLPNYQYENDVFQDGEQITIICE
jgi:hypothetical protein